jgi:16S rRNA (uracil1498-N3)-methyltransferase
MRIHRVFTGQPLEPGGTVALAEDTAHYLSRVLRVTMGQMVVVFNGDGFDYSAEINRLDRGVLGVLVQSRLPARPESPLQIRLVQAVSRGERMDLTLQKATELGVTEVQPLFSARTEVRLKGEKLLRRMEHWRKVVISACEQSGRACLPVLHAPVDLEEWVQSAPLSQRLVCLPDAGRSLASLGVHSALEVLIGPEGGFDDHELELLAGQGVMAVGLGPRVLRTETAGAVAITVLQALAGDLA